MSAGVCLAGQGLLAFALVVGCRPGSGARPGSAAWPGSAERPGAAARTEASLPDLVGQWRATVSFRDGAFAALHDLEFMYVFNAGGTMTESSNYDASPPVPPAYGIWRRTGPGSFEARYEFYMTAAPADLGELARGGGWTPAGRGILTETITLGTDGDSYTSVLRYQPLDPGGRPGEGGGEATGSGVRLKF